LSILTSWLDFSIAIDALGWAENHAHAERSFGNEHQEAIRNARSLGKSLI
jgi:hypothetical protein